MTSKRNSLGFLIAEVHRSMRRAFEEHLVGDDALTMAQARALIAVSRHEGIRQVDLAELLEVRPITLARLLDQLAGHGLVERRPDPTDRRAHHLFLTQEAAPHLAAIGRVAKAICSSALRGIDSEQIKTLFLVLEKMRDNLAAR